MIQPKRPLDENYTWQEIYERVCNRVPILKRKIGFKKWFMQNEKNGYLFDPLMIARCFKIYRDMKNKDKDSFILLTGREGTGKSTFASQLMAWVDPNSKVENFCFTPEQYLERLKKTKKGGCLVLDEGGFMLFSRESMSESSINLTKLFMLQRQKNISVIVVCPSFWDIDAYIRRHRIDSMIRIIDQGGYMGYLPKAISIINDVGYRKKPLTKIKLPNGSFWHGQFRKKFPKSIDRDKYLAMKREHLDEFISSLEIDMGKPLMMPSSKVAKQMGLNAQQMRRRIESGAIKGKKIGDRWFIPKKEYESLVK